MGAAAQAMGRRAFPFGFAQDSCFGWAARFRRLACSLEGFHWLAFAALMLNSFFR